MKTMEYRQFRTSPLSPVAAKRLASQVQSLETRLHQRPRRTVAPPMSLYQTRTRTLAGIPISTLTLAAASVTLAISSIITRYTPVFSSLVELGYQVKNGTRTMIDVLRHLRSSLDMVRGVSSQLASSAVVNNTYIPEVSLTPPPLLPKGFDTNH